MMLKSFFKDEQPTKDEEIEAAEDEGFMINLKMGGRRATKESTRSLGKTPHHHHHNNK